MTHFQNSSGRRNSRNTELTIDDVSPCGMNFNAIDVETANENNHSICSIGIVHVREGQMVDRWSTLVDPEEEFQPVNIGIHGIRPSDVAGAPTMPQLREVLCRRLRGEVLVSHGPFDRVAFRHAMEKYGLEPLQVYWIDSIMVAKRAWYDDSEIQSFGLAPLASHLDILFNHHVAIEDAEVAAKILMKACEYRKVTVDYWLTAVENPIPKYEKRAIERKVAEQSEYRSATPIALVDGPLSGERVVFTGSMSITRTEAKEVALSMGCEVRSSVTQRTTILVVGNQSISQIKSGAGKSSKHVKAEQLISQGHEIVIMTEDDFLYLFEDVSNS